MIVRADPTRSPHVDVGDIDRSPFKLAGRDAKAAPTVIQVRDLCVGGDRLALIAGPCAVESREQLLSIARQVKASGATALRGGAFKPRTSPYSFQGLKEEGLRLLSEARAETGLAVVTEVLSPEHVELVAAHADVLQIGARNMQNYPLLEAVGKTRLPVLLKRGPSATIEELLFATEHVMCRGNERVMLCERGIRTFEDHVRFTLALSSVPYLHQVTHLPVLVDPSHGTGDASLVPTMSRAAVAAGADGLLLEVHVRPAEALSDGPQALTPKQFEQLMSDCQKIRALVSPAR